MKRLIPFIICLLSLESRAQCRSGDCVNGKGTYDFGWCVYTGAFVNGKPEGEGSMKYADYTYTGHFKAGLEDGDGIETRRDGQRTMVKYAGGKKKVSQLQHVDTADFAALVAQDPGCKDGNCVTGFGTYVFPSGNKYVGNFKDRKRNGQGTFFFASGDKFEGEFLANDEYSGSYTYSTGAKYVGTYLTGGREYNGTIYSPSGKAVPFINGKPIIPPPPPAEKEHYGTCSCCHGRGTIVNASMHNDVGYANGHYGEVFYTLYRDIPCNCCHGTGAASDQDPRAKADRFDINYYRDVIR